MAANPDNVLDLNIYTLTTRQAVRHFSHQLACGQIADPHFMFFLRI
jgi:hypothetical protein